MTLEHRIFNDLNFTKSNCKTLNGEKYKRLKIANSQIQNGNAIMSFTILLIVFCKCVYVCLTGGKMSSNENNVKIEKKNRMISNDWILNEYDVEKLVSLFAWMVKMLEQSLKFRSVL